MPDRETIITRLQIINTWATVDLRSPKEPIWSYRTLEDVQQWTNDAIALLKEQEPAMPTWRQGKAYCGKCGQRLPRKRADREINYCGYCGQAVKWND